MKYLFGLMVIFIIFFISRYLVNGEPKYEPVNENDENETRVEDDEHHEVFETHEGEHLDNNVKLN